MSRRFAFLAVAAGLALLVTPCPAPAASLTDYLGAAARGTMQGLEARRQQDWQDEQRRQYLALQRAQEELVRIEAERHRWELEQLRQTEGNRVVPAPQLPPPQVAVTFSGMEGLAEVYLAVEGVPGVEELYEATGATPEDIRTTAVRLLSSRPGPRLANGPPAALLVMRMNGMLVRDAEGKPWAYVMNTETYLHQLAFLARPGFSDRRVLLGGIPSTWHQSQMLVGFINEGTKSALLRSVETVLGCFLDEYRRANPALAAGSVGIPLSPSRGPGTAVPPR